MSTLQTGGTGRIVAAHGRRGLLEVDTGDTHAYVVRSRRDRAVCGDQVDWEAGQDDTLTVTGVQQRHNALRRLDPGRQATEILAANLSLLAVVCARAPAPDWFVIDRYLCAATDMGAKGLLIVNKTDTGLPEASELENYRAIGYTVLAVSATNGTGVDTLAEEFADEVGILVGQSGVGKSSLINCLVPGMTVDTATLSSGTDEGRHTTTASVMHRLPNGGRLIDSPGVRDFLPVIDEEPAVQAGFPEILKLADDCRFANCRHLREPRCAVKAALAAGEVSERRYESYRRLLRSVQSRDSG